MQDYHDLHVWRRAHRLSMAIRRLVHTFPRTGFSSLKEQMIRSAESIPTNIVEGCGAATRPEFARYLDIRIKSTSELQYQLESSRDCGLLSGPRWKAFSDEDIEIRRMLCGLRATVVEAHRREARRKKAMGEKKGRHIRPGHRVD